MEILNIIGSVCSVVSLVVSIFVASKVIRIGNDVRVKGDKNFVVGRDVKM